MSNNYFYTALLREEEVRAQEERMGRFDRKHSDCFFSLRYLSSLLPASCQKHIFSEKMNLNFN